MSVHEPVKRAALSIVALRIGTVAWLTLLVVGALQPARPDFVKGVHREIHWVAFAGAALLLIAVVRTRRQETVGVFTVFCLGLCLEILQHLLYRNPIEWRDVSDDGLAIMVAFACYHLTRVRKAAFPPHR